MEQLERIARMEQALDASAQAVDSLAAALDKYLAALPDLKALSDYQTSGAWLADYADDQAGRLPVGLRRGVLAEDTLYDLLRRNDGLLACLRALSER